jgi:hypothetical protein
MQEWGTIKRPSMGIEQGEKVQPKSIDSIFGTIIPGNVPSHERELSRNRRF